jgi:uncharacterized membrane protein YagU involved in acid resistance
MATVKIAPIETSAGDSAVDGLSGGLLAGLLMAAFLVIVAWIGGEGPAQFLARFDLQATPTPLVGGLIHLALSGVYGIAYGLAFWLLLRRGLAGKSIWVGALAGAMYGLLLWLAADLILLPAANSPLQAVPGWAFALGHVFFGALLGAWVLRNAVRRQASALG